MVSGPLLIFAPEANRVDSFRHLRHGSLVCSAHGVGREDREDRGLESQVNAHP